MHSIKTSQKGKDNRENIEALASAVPLNSVLSDLKATITGDHEIFRAIAGVHNAGTAVH